MSHHSTMPIGQDDQPVFVNRHNVSVDVFDENRQRLTVFPLATQQRFPSAVYFVKGGHYQQFSDVGSLAPFQNGKTVNPPDPAEIRRIAAAEAMVAERKRVAASIEQSRKSTAAAPAVIAPPLDTETAYLIQRASPDANAQQRADLAAYVLKRKAGDPVYQLPATLASYTAAMDKIVSGEIPAGNVQHDTHTESPMDEDSVGKPKAGNPKKK